MTAFITKRPHKKSRGGCKTCKVKKIKCDEGQPRCGYCEKRNLTCVFIQPKSLFNSPCSPQESQSGSSRSSSPSSDTSTELSWPLLQTVTPVVSTSAGNLQQSQLRGLHFWTAFTSNMITPGDISQTVLQITVPQLSFNNDFLLHTVLGISSSHMRALLPDDEESRMQARFHRGQAFKHFREALTKIDPFKGDTWEAALVTAILLTIVCARDDDLDAETIIAVKWLNLYRGLITIISMRDFDDVRESRVGSVFRREINQLIVEPMVPLKLARMLDEIDPSEPDFEDLDRYRKALDMLGILYASLYQDGLGPAIQTRVIAWPSFISMDFTDLANEKRPRALILLAHYMCFVRLQEDCWWMEGIAERDLTQILKMVPPRLYRFLEIPCQVMVLKTVQEMKHLLLMSVNEMYSPIVKTSADYYTEAVGWFTHGRHSKPLGAIEPSSMNC